MSEVKRIMISLPETLLKQVDLIAASESLNRSEFIREAMRLYIEERNKRELRDQMRLGYMEMAQINLSLANESLMIEKELEAVEWKIAEGE